MFTLFERSRLMPKRKLVLLRNNIYVLLFKYETMAVEAQWTGESIGFRPL